MIKKTFDNYSLSQNEKDALFERISNTVANNSSEKAEEKKNNKIPFMKYAAAAASVILLTGVTALVLHLATPGQPIEISTPQNSNSGMVNSTDNSGTRPEYTDVLGLPFYKDSAVINMQPQASGYENSEAVRFAEVKSDSGEYTYIVAGDFIRREENRYEARLNLYLYKGNEMLGTPAKFDIGAGTLYYNVTKEDMEQFESRLLKVHSASQNGETYPLIALSHRVSKSVMEDLFYSDEYEYGTIFFSVKDDQLFRFAMNGDFNTCYPEFEMKTVSDNKITDKKGWITEFDFENESAYTDATFYSSEEQELLDNLLPFEDSNIPVYDEFMGNSDIPYAKVLIDAKTCGEYTFTLYAGLVKNSDNPNDYSGYFDLIVSKNGKALENEFIAAAHDASQYAMRIPKDYNYSNMLKVYTMTQNGRAYPLASVTYNIPDETIADGFGANSLTRFFTVRNGVGEPFTDNSTDYKDLPSEVQVTDLSISDSVNGKKIIFDFEKRQATVINLGDGEINIKQRPYYKDSRIYNEAIFDDYDIVRFAEKSYKRYDFVLGGRLERKRNGFLYVTLNIYLYKDNQLIGTYLNLSDGADTTQFMLDKGDEITFGDTVLDIQDMATSFGEPFPVAVVTCKATNNTDILTQMYPTESFTTFSRFFTVKGDKLCLFSEEDGLIYPDYADDVSVFSNGLSDKKGWNIYFSYDELVVSVSPHKAYNITIKINGEGYAEKSLTLGVITQYSHKEPSVPFTTDKTGTAHFDSLPYGTYIITDESGHSIVDGNFGLIGINASTGNMITVNAKDVISEGKNAISLPYYKDFVNMGPQKEEDGTGVTVRFSEISHGEYRFVVAGEFVRRSEQIYKAHLNVYAYKNNEYLCNLGKLATGEADNGLTVNDTDIQSFADNLLSVKTLTQNGKEYPLIVLAVTGDGFENYRGLTNLFPITNKFTIVDFFSINKADGMPYKFDGLSNFDIYSPTIDSSVITKENTITNNKEWTLVFDFEKCCASITPFKASNISLSFEGEKDYANKTFYLTEYTLDESTNTPVISFTTDNNGTAHFDELECRVYAVTDENGNKIADGDSHDGMLRIVQSSSGCSYIWRVED